MFVSSLFPFHLMQYNTHQLRFNFASAKQESKSNHKVCGMVEQSMPDKDAKYKIDSKITFYDSIVKVTLDPIIRELETFDLNLSPELLI